MIGYKATDMDGCCRGFKFEVGKTYTKDTKKEDLRCCTDTGFHFCRELWAIEKESNYKLSESRLFEVIAGDVVRDGNKYCTNSITILREIEGEEKLSLINTGNCNTGDRNTGYRNTGNCNTGNWNTGNCNTGYRNTGNWNTGNCNTGDFNTGDRNTGDFNTGDCNTGDCNTGYCNTGNCNTGYFNTGDRNTGNWNTGNWNTGDFNTGDRNTGNCNTGNWNTGDCNTGYCNTGNWNTGYFNTGYFNTNEPFVRMFNKDTNNKREDLSFPSFLYFDLTVWVSHDTATDAEKKAHKQEIEVYGGFLKKLDYKEAFRISWNKASLEEHKKLFDLPNWDNDIFKEISGIDAEAEIAKEEKKCGE